MDKTYISNNYHSINRRFQGPITANDEKRELRAVIASENPVNVFYMGDTFGEILLMAGANYPEQVPLVDSHDTRSIDSLLGSVVGFAVNDFGEIEATVRFSDTEEGKRAYALYRDGHITDFSVGSMIDEVEIIPRGESKDGFDGPVILVRKWTIKEVSAAIIGLDETAKARSYKNDNNIGDEKMGDELKTDEKEKDQAVITEGAEGTVNVSAVRAKTATVEDLNALSEADIKAGLKVETQRCLEISDLCRKHNIEPNKYIERGDSLVDVKLDILDNIKTTTERAAVGVTYGEDEIDKFQEGASAALMQRAGFGKDIDMAGNNLRGYTMFELARESLRRSGQSTHGTRKEIATRAMTSDDFPNLISTTAYKTMMIGFNEVINIWPRLATVGSVPNYLQQEKVGVSRGGYLTKLTSADPEIPFGNRSDEKEVYIIDSYAKAFSYSKKSLVNDSFNVLGESAEHGRMAKRTEDKVFFDFLKSNPTMGDGNALFSSAHSNLASGGDAAAPGLATMNTADTAMSEQLDLDGETSLDISPFFIVAPRTLKGYTSQFLGSPWWNDEATIGTPDYSTAGTRKNVWQDILEEIYTGKLQTGTNGSDTAWYLFARKGQTFEMFFLNGNQSPTVESQKDFRTKDLEITIEHDIGARAESWKGVYKNPGA